MIPFIVFVAPVIVLGFLFILYRGEYLLIVSDDVGEFNRCILKDKIKSIEMNEAIITIKYEGEIIKDFSFQFVIKRENDYIKVYNDLIMCQKSKLKSKINIDDKKYRIDLK